MCNLNTELSLDDPTFRTFHLISAISYFISAPQKLQCIKVLFMVLLLDGISEHVSHSMVFGPLLKKSLGNHYLKILYILKLFVVDATMKKIIQKI